MKRITILGSTGTIGRRALELVAQFPERLAVAGLAARGSNLELLREQVRRHRPQAVALLDPGAVDRLARELPPPRPELFGGLDGITAVAAETDAALVLSALVGGVGLLPTMAAIRAGRRVALANKEALVMAGALMTSAARAAGVELFPVDSEHSAVFQCLAGGKREEVRRILLTASGGPFASRPREELERVTPAEALRHPTWRMGAKITVDSATLMNKGLEIIEAFWLFGLPLSRIEVVIHPQSIVHSMVEFVDGSVLAQLGVPDMGIPILYALTYPDRVASEAPILDLTRVGTLTFLPPDAEKFPCLALARQAAEAGGSAPVVLNAANEVAVEAFLAGRIGFTRIPGLIAEALEAHPPRAVERPEECPEIDAETRRWSQVALGTVAARS
ncbi:MAG: 1-deoxy-D-xylulose-5-phosphate reductoisomerase [Candidatus Rokubacteria bacterium]|nr:1-deoxy-D-xylulose-5-phosphate reductoisomerase [Candidatus Rokubacteria bacterium]